MMNNDKKEKKKSFLKQEKTKKNEKKPVEKKLSQEDYKNKYLRALADYQNLLKRSLEEKREFAKFANENFLIEILPVYDNLKMSLDHTDKEVEASGWATGIKYIVKQFKDFLEANGVEEINTQGENFNHDTMEALKGNGEKVIKELKSGYKLKGKVIVAAKVELE